MNPGSSYHPPALEKSMTGFDYYGASLFSGKTPIPGNRKSGYVPARNVREHDDACTVKSVHG